MAHLARLVAAAALALAALAAFPAASRAACPALDFDEMCVDQPPVTAATTNTGITIPRGSWVKMRADGCVQTGGSGNTWKRYVDPDPPNRGSGMFAGSIGILSLTGGPATIADHTRFFDISPVLRFRVTTDSFVQFGYSDDGYGDNGYYSHDDGTNAQCRIPPGQWGYGDSAFVVLTIDHNSPPANVSAAQPPVFVTGLTQLQAFGNDPDFDPISWKFLIDGANVAEGAQSTVMWNAQGDGLRTLRIQATDSWGATTTSGPVSFTVDNTPPTVAITGGPAGQVLPPGSTQTWTFAANDGGGSGVQGVQCKLDGAPVTCTTPTSHTASHLPAGTHTFAVTATDRLGHVSAPESRTFTIATPTPTPQPTPLPTVASPPAATPTPLPTVVPTVAPPRLIRSTVVFAYASFTRLTRLTVKHVPTGATVRLTCSGPCPKDLRHPWSKRVSGGSLALVRLLRGQVRPGMKVVIAVSKPGWIGTKKTLRIRRGKAPTVD